MASLRIFGLLVLLLVGISSRADAAVLCANASGMVFVREACGRNETRLDPVALGLVGPQGPTGPKGPQGEQGPAGAALFANVTGTGVLTNGTATSVSRLSTGFYVVTFAQNVSQCAVVATPGSTGTGASRLNAWANASLGFIGTEVQIRFNGPDPDTVVTPVDTDFHLIVVC